MAAPVVAGVAALALCVHPNLSVAQLRAVLHESVDKLPALRGKVSTGGRINAALDRWSPGPAAFSPPIFPPH